eukprot:SAG25_NODE_345_length_9393_cov_4.870468_2_plen_57_part_00
MGAGLVGALGAMVLTRKGRFHLHTSRLCDGRQHRRPRLGVHVDIGERNHDAGGVRG